MEALKNASFYADLEVGGPPFGRVNKLKCYGLFIVVSVLVSTLLGSVAFLDTAFGCEWCSSYSGPDSSDVQKLDVFHLRLRQ